MGDSESQADTASLSHQPPVVAVQTAKAGGGISDQNKVIFRIRPSFYSVGMAYAIATILSLLVSGAIGYFDGPLWVVFTAAAVFFLVPVYRHIQRNRITYTLTPVKIEIDSGIFSKTIQNIPLRNIQDITTRATLGERLLGIGDVIIDSAAEASKITMRNIRDPRKHADLILDQMRRWN